MLARHLLVAVWARRHRNRALRRCYCDVIARVAKRNKYPAGTRPVINAA